ncbi:MAG: LD-carboxypeptidase [Bacteroidetes bacterium]|nr:LD-carboxypeptidase [Bacteroidota bacterium]
MSIRPELLSKKDKVAIVATARKINLSEIDYSIKLLSNWGLEVVVGKTIGLENNQFAGDDTQRAEDIQRFLDDKDIKAIFCARGGYGSVRIIDKLDFKEFSKHPKWIIGYSDPTVLLMHIYFNLNIETIHGIMPYNINEDSSTSLAISSLKECLFKKTSLREYPSNSFNCRGKAKGDLIGGNLSILYSLLGSSSFGETEGKILFIEDLDEYLYHIDRIMQALKRVGKLDKLAGLIVGEFSLMHDNTIPFGKTAYEIISEAVKGYNYPKAFNIPIGHIEEKNIAFVIGRETSLTIDNDKIIIEQ